MPWNYKDIRHRLQTFAENQKSSSAPAKPLSYANKNKEPLLFREAVVWSEWQDLNLRPLPPQGSALPICATPSCFQRCILYHRKTTLSIPFFKKFMMLYKKLAPTLKRIYLRQHRAINKVLSSYYHQKRETQRSTSELPIRLARVHWIKLPDEVCQPESDSPGRTWYSGSEKTTV